MRYRKLGQSDVQVSEISLGCWTLGGLNWSDGSPNGWANVDEADVQKAVDFALDRGVNHFDNADVYGNGRAERMLARVLGTRSKNVVIATKVGHFRGTADHAYEPAHIRHQCEQSLVNLDRDFIDVYYFHHGDFGPNDRYLDHAIEVVRALKKEGKIRLLGLSAYSADDFVRLVPRIEPDVLQSWAHCSDAHFIEARSPVRTLLDDRKMSFVAFSPLQQGLLLGKYKAGTKPQFAEGDFRKNAPDFKDENIATVAARVDRMKSRFGSDVKSLARAALQYVLSFPCVACAIPGFRNLAQVEANLAGSDQPLTDDDVAFVRQTFAG